MDDSMMENADMQGSEFKLVLVEFVDDAFNYLTTCKFVDGTGEEINYVNPHVKTDLQSRLYNAVLSAVEE